MAHIKHSVRRLTSDCKRLNQERSAIFTVACAMLKLLCLSPQFIIAKRLKVRLKLTNVIYGLSHFFKHALIATAKNFCSNFTEHLRDSLG